MSLCEIPTTDPKNPALIEASVITHVIRDEIDVAGLCLHERGCDAVCVVKTDLTTREVVALLEAHKKAQEEQGGIWARAVMDRVAASGERINREAILLQGLLALSETGNRNTRRAVAEILRDAGVGDAEPEKGTQT
jgi:hypothetical protein